jgi:hypothetical protein
VDPEVLQREAAALLDDVRKAFPVDGPPDPSTITTHFCPTCADLRATLGGLAWSAVPDDILDETVTVNALLSPMAFRYYLPAFMCRAIASPLNPGVGASRVLDYVAMSLCLHAGDAWWLERMQGLTPPQRRVIRAFLQWASDVLIDQEEERTRMMIHYALRPYGTAAGW